MSIMEYGVRDHMHIPGGFLPGGEAAAEKR
jgi:hypothetical protein